MRVSDFQFFVTDDRYSVPTLMLVQAKDGEAARDIAKRLLLEHDHYHAIEVWTVDKHLFTVGLATPSPRPSAPTRPSA